MFLSFSSNGCLFSSGCLPGKFDASFLSHICLSISAVNNVSSIEVPFASTFWHIVVERALEVAAVRVLPFTLNQLTLLVAANKFLARLVENVGALAFLLTVGPLSRVDILIHIVHDTLTVTLSVEPVAVVGANTTIGLFADSALEIFLPGAAIGVSDCVLKTSGNSIGVDTVTRAFLKSNKE